MATSDQVYLITGANKGLGRLIAETWLARQNTVVVAGVRDLSSAQDLERASRGTGSKLITVKIDSTSESDAAEAIRLLKSEHHIQKLDVVLANAGYGTVYGTPTQVKPQDIRDTFEVNAIGPLVLFQATRQLLEASPNPRFVLSGSPIGSIAGMEKQDLPLVAYGASKAMAHYLTRKIHFAHHNITTFVINPGFMKTDMGNTGARYLGMKEAIVDPEDSAVFAVAQIDKATRADTSGKFVSIEETALGGFYEW